MSQLVGFGGSVFFAMLASIGREVSTFNAAPSAQEWWRPRPERRAGRPLSEGRQLGRGDMAKLGISGLRMVWLGYWDKSQER